MTTSPIAYEIISSSSVENEDSPSVKNIDDEKTLGNECSSSLSSSSKRALLLHETANNGTSHVPKRTKTNQDCVIYSPNGHDHVKDDHLSKDNEKRKCHQLDDAKEAAFLWKKIPNLEHQHEHHHPVEDNRDEKNNTNDSEKQDMKELLNSPKDDPDHSKKHSESYKAQQPQSDLVSTVSVSVADQNEECHNPLPLENDNNNNNDDSYNDDRNYDDSYDEESNDEESYNEESNNDNSDRLPPCAQGEYDVVIPWTDHGLMLNIGTFGSFCIFVGYRSFPDGSKGPAEEENLIRNIGDQIRAVDGVPTNKKTLPEVIQMMTKTKGIKSPCVRFLEVHKDDVYSIKTMYQLRQSDALETKFSKSKPIPIPKQKPKLTPKTKLKPKLKDCSPQLPTKSKQHEKSKKSQSSTANDYFDSLQQYSMHLNTNSRSNEIFHRHHQQQQQYTFDPESTDDATWYYYFDLLMDFIREQQHKHDGQTKFSHEITVAHLCHENEFELANWLSIQIKEYQQLQLHGEGKSVSSHCIQLTSDRIAALNLIGVDWGTCFHSTWLSIMNRSNCISATASEQNDVMDHPVPNEIKSSSFMPNVINPSETLEGSFTTNIIADNIGPSKLNPSASSLLEPKSSTTHSCSSTSTTTAANSEILHDQQSLDSVATDDNGDDEDYDYDDDDDDDDDGGEVFDSIDYDNNDDEDYDDNDNDNDNEVFDSLDYDNNDDDDDDEDYNDNDNDNDNEVFDSIDYDNNNDDDEVFGSVDYDNNDNEKDDSSHIPMLNNIWSRTHDEIQQPRRMEVKWDIIPKTADQLKKEKINMDPSQFQKCYWWGANLIPHDGTTYHILHSVDVGNKKKKKKDKHDSTTKRAAVKAPIYMLDYDPYWEIGFNTRVISHVIFLNSHYLMDMDTQQTLCFRFEGSKWDENDAAKSTDASALINAAIAAAQPQKKQTPAAPASAPTPAITSVPTSTSTLAPASVSVHLDRQNDSNQQLSFENSSHTHHSSTACTPDLSHHLKQSSPKAFDSHEQKHANYEPQVMQNTTSTTTNNIGIIENSSSLGMVPMKTKLAALPPSSFTTQPSTSSVNTVAILPKDIPKQQQIFTTTGYSQSMVKAQHQKSPSSESYSVKQNSFSAPSSLMTSMKSTIEAAAKAEATAADVPQVNIQVQIQIPPQNRNNMIAHSYSTNSSCHTEPLRNPNLIQQHSSHNAFIHRNDNHYESQYSQSMSREQQQQQQEPPYTSIVKRDQQDAFIHLKDHHYESQYSQSMSREQQQQQLQEPPYTSIVKRDQQGNVEFSVTTHIGGRDITQTQTPHVSPVQQQLQQQLQVYQRPTRSPTPAFAQKSLSNSQQSSHHWRTHQTDYHAPNQYQHQYQHQYHQHPQQYQQHQHQHHSYQYHQTPSSFNPCNYGHENENVYTNNTNPPSSSFCNQSYYGHENENIHTNVSNPSSF